MKHSYDATCNCARCDKESNRRRRQALNDGRARFYAQPVRRSRRPVHGSQEWAETRGDDIPSYDQPGDDFDNGCQ